MLLPTYTAVADGLLLTTEWGFRERVSGFGDSRESANPDSHSDQPLLFYVGKNGKLQELHRICICMGGDTAAG